MRRDLLASIRGTICLPRPAKVRVPFMFKPDKIVEFKNVLIYMFNELFDSFYHNYRDYFMTLIQGSVEQFWAQVRVTKTQRCLFAKILTCLYFHY